MTLGTQVFPSEFAAKFAEASLVNYIRFRPGAGGHDGLGALTASFWKLTGMLRRTQPWSKWPK